tara:strand:- start:22957 stop:23304 length:348 start_codon:yes stop_codon:yes gene_type:complete
MTIKSGIGIDAQYVPTANAAIVTPTAGTRMKITSATFFANTGAATLNLFIVASGGSPSAINQTTVKAMVANETYVANELIGQTIEDGGTLQANDGAGAGSDIAALITVTQYSGTS